MPGAFGIYLNLKNTKKPLDIPNKSVLSKSLKILRYSLGLCKIAMFGSFSVYQYFNNPFVIWTIELMTNEKQEAYRFLLYMAMLWIRNHTDIKAVGAVANWLHNLAGDAIHTPLEFNEEFSDHGLLLARA
jgi:hypothetical protein